jgi:hypothetical protein
MYVKLWDDGLMEFGEDGCEDDARSEWYEDASDKVLELADESTEFTYHESPPGRTSRPMTLEEFQEWAQPA